MMRAVDWPVAGGGASGRAEKAEPLLVANDVVNAAPVDGLGGTSAGGVMMASSVILTGSKVESGSVPAPAEAPGEHAPHDIPLSQLLALGVVLSNGFLLWLPIAGASMVTLLVFLMTGNLFALSLGTFVLLLPIFIVTMLHRSASEQFRLIREYAWAEGSLTEQVYQDGQRFLHYKYTARTTHLDDLEFDTVVPDTVQAELSSSHFTPERVLVLYDPAHSRRVRGQKARIIFGVTLSADSTLQLRRSVSMGGAMTRVACSVTATIATVSLVLAIASSQWIYDND